MNLGTIEKDLQQQIDKILDIHNNHLRNLQLGMVDPELFYNIPVSDKGKKVFLKNLTVISFKDDVLIIKPNNISLIKEIEKSINNMKKDFPLKFTVVSEKTQINLKFDLLITQEMRNIFASLCNKKTEEFRVSLRNLRQDIFKQLKNVIKNDEELKRQTKNLQNLFDKANKILDDKEKIKIKSLMG